MRVAKENATAGDSVDVWCADDVVDASRSFHVGIDAGETSPIVSEEKENVGRLGIGFVRGGCGRS